jgi:DNA-binding HxlR family transcriptional regulator
LHKVSASMETISKKKEGKGKGLPVLNKNIECNFEGYDASLLMSETAKLRDLITKRGTLEILIPLCCTTNPVRHKQFRQTLKGFSTRTLSIRLRELEKGGILERHRYNEIPTRVEYTLTIKGQELVESVVDILQWMRKWAKVRRSNDPVTVTQV